MGSLGVPGLNGAAFNQPGMNPSFPTPVLPTTAIPSFVNEPVGQPSECLLLKNMFDPATEVNSCFFFFCFVRAMKNQVSALFNWMPADSFLELLLTSNLYFAADGTRL